MDTIYIVSIDKHLHRHEFLREMGKTGTLSQKIDYFNKLTSNGECDFLTVDKLKKDFKLYVKQFKVSSFVPPTHEEVVEYFNYLAERDWGLVAEKFAEIFIGHYSLRNWTYGKAKIKMVDWKATIRNTWNIHDHIKKHRGLFQQTRSIEERQRAFYMQIASIFERNGSMYPKEMYRAFYNKWAQPDFEQRTLRFENEEYWDLELRLEEFSQTFYGQANPSFSNTNRTPKKEQSRVTQEQLRKALGIEGG
jgi:hypothetical protein